MGRSCRCARGVAERQSVLATRRRKRDCVIGLTWLGYVESLGHGVVSPITAARLSARALSTRPPSPTLPQVVAVQREADSRLTLLVQGLARGYALRATQTLPYARADFAILPDEEQLLSSARLAGRFLAASGWSEKTDGTHDGAGCGATRDTSRTSPCHALQARTACTSCSAG